MKKIPLAGIVIPQHDEEWLVIRRVIPAQAGIHCVLLNFETGWNTIAPDLVSPTKIVIPAQAGIGTLNRAQRASIKYF